MSCWTSRSFSNPLSLLQFFSFLAKLDTIVSVALLEPFSFVERCLNLTAANIDSIRLASQLFIVTTATSVSFKTEITLRFDGGRIFSHTEFPSPEHTSPNTQQYRHTLFWQKNRIVRPKVHIQSSIFQISS